jgi:hypothetical protein
VRRAVVPHGTVGSEDSGCREGFRDLTEEEAKAVDAEHLRQLRRGHLRPVAGAA